MKFAIMFATAALLANSAAALTVAFSFHTEEDGGGDEVENLLVEPDDFKLFGNKCVKVDDDDDDMIKSVKIDKGDDALGDYCVRGYDKAACKDEDHVFEYPFEQYDIDQGYWNFATSVKYAKVVAEKCKSWEESDGDDEDDDEDEDDGDDDDDDSETVTGGVLDAIFK